MYWGLKALVTTKYTDLWTTSSNICLLYTGPNVIFFNINQYKAGQKLPRNPKVSWELLESKKVSPNAKSCSKAAKHILLKPTDSWGNMFLLENLFNGINLCIKSRSTHPDIWTSRKIKLFFKHLKLRFILKMKELNKLSTK